MISVTEARRIISKNLTIFGKKEVGFLDSGGCILAEDIVADRDFPPFNRVTMDGIALRSSRINEGQLEFHIEHLQPAGSRKVALSDISNAIEVMTGAILPENADAVIRYEDLEIFEREGKKFARVMIDSVDPFKNVHQQGEDKVFGDVLIKKGTLISSPEISVFATTGKKTVKVFEFPRTAIISTGDELVEVDNTPLEHQIRKSNVYAIYNELKNLGVEASLFHLKDNKEELETRLKEIFNDYPLVILSGGVSKGKLDFVPGIMEELGIEKKFHFVTQRPGKPLWFGTSDKNVVFALPGNPVSTYMCFMIYVKTWLLICLNVEVQQYFATLDSDASFKPNLTYFMQVKLYFDEDSRLMAKPVIGHGSGDLANLVKADAFMELPSGQTLFNSGTSFPVHIFRQYKVISDLEG